MLKDWLTPHPNSFFVHYRFTAPDGKHYENILMFPHKLRDAIKEQGLKPLNTCRLYPAIYCYQNGLDPLVPENSQQVLRQSTDYQFTAFSYSELQWYHSYIGIQTDRGVLLFDNTDDGETLQKLYYDFLINHFFDPRLDITFLRTMELLPNEEQKAKVNPEMSFAGLYDTESAPFGILPANCYIDMKEVGIYTESEQYDMSPTLDNFVRFAGLDRGEIPDLLDDTYNIGCLLYLSSPKCSTPDIKDELPNFFYYGDRFNPLSEQFAKAATEEEKVQIMASVRELAGHLLKRDFPTIRQPRQAEQARKEQDKAAVTPDNRRARQLPDVAAKLAKLAKTPKQKGKGIR